MNIFEQRKLKETVLYLLNATGGLDYYRVFKLLYFAEREHLAKWGHKMIADDFCALDYGPVPTQLYDAIKVLNMEKTNLASILHQDIVFAGEDAPYVLIPKRLADMDYISDSEKEMLDKSINENASLTFEELLKKSHDIAWKEAHDRKKSGKISIVKMAEAVCADEKTIEYINEQLELEEALS